MSKNSPLQNYQAATEWLESKRRERKSKRKNQRNGTTPTQHRSKPNFRRSM
jgi:hypothetical protein